MYQKCPICNGSGLAPTLTSSNSTCPCCHGSRIIDEVTGLPPYVGVRTNSNTTSQIVGLNKIEKENKRNI